MSALLKMRPRARCTLAAGIHQLKFRGIPGQNYFLAVPESRQADHIIVLVHGISRNTHALVESFWPLIKKRRIALFAPLFNGLKYKDYQRLGRNEKGPRADLALNAMLAELGTMTGWKTDKALYFGHSAGAQYVQRYLFAHPHRVKKAALSAAGWYTFPVNRKYPSGIRLNAELPGVQFEPQRFLRVPTAVFIGLEDTIRDESLNCSRLIDRQQGTTRLERARNWVNSMHQASEKYTLKPNVELIELPGIYHDYNNAVVSAQLNQLVLDWLLSEEGKTR